MEKQDIQKRIEEEQRIKSLINKSKILGYSVKEIKTYCKHYCTLVSKDENNHILYIPDDVIQLNDTNTDLLTFTQHIQNIQGRIKVIGGHNLKDVYCMFCDCQVQSIDLSSFDTSKVTNMRGMFCDCQVKSIDLSSFDTSKVTNMCTMFFRCKAQSIDLSSFDTSNVKDMWNMFEGCKVQSLDLSNFDTSNVKDMHNMFYYCKAQFLDLSSFDTSNVIDMSGMFYECQAQIKATDSKILKACNRYN